MKSDPLDANGDDGKEDKTWRRAAWVWIVFFVLLVAINGTIPFVLGVNMRGWTASWAKALLVNFGVYGGVSLVLPLVLLKGSKMVLRSSFLLPLLVAVVGVGVWDFVPYAATLTILALIYLHLRFDLSGYGIRSRGWKGDLAALIILGVLQMLAVFLEPGPISISLGNGVAAGAYRLFVNPASTVENFFYFGFITEGLSKKTGRFLTPLLIAAMYTAHEMSNPEYWYGGTSFPVIFIGVLFMAILYLWRRSAIPMWLGEGLGSFLTGMLRA